MSIYNETKIWAEPFASHQENSRWDQYRSKGYRATRHEGKSPDIKSKHTTSPTEQPPHPDSIHKLTLDIASMQHSTRTTRSKTSPGLIDRPNPRCPSTVVTEEKAKKQKAATLKAEEQCRHIA